MIEAKTFNSINEWKVWLKENYPGGGTISSHVQLTYPPIHVYIATVDGIVVSKYKEKQLKNNSSDW